MPWSTYVTSVGGLETTGPGERGCRLRVLTAAELSGPFEPEEWPHVFAVDVAYWRPANLGEALFDYWD